MYYNIRFLEKDQINYRCDQELAIIPMFRTIAKLVEQFTRLSLSDPKNL